MVNRNPYPGAQTVSRAVALLKAFTDARPEWSASDLARAAGLNKTTTYRLLKALECEGMLARNPATDAFRLGPEIIALGARAARALDVRTVSRPELETLAHQTGETATLEVLAGGKVLILDEVLSQRLLGAAQSIGTRWPAHATSTGKSLLAELSEAERRATLRPPLARLTDKTITTLSALRHELARIRERGYATAIEELEAGFVAVGAPVRNHQGRAVAAISIGGPSIRLTEDRLADVAGHVVQAARRISEELGYRMRKT